AVAGRVGGGLGRTEVGAAAVVVDGELSPALREPRVGDLTAAWDGGVGVLADVRSVGGVHVLGDPVDVHTHAPARDLVAEVHLDAVANRSAQHQRGRPPWLGLDLGDGGLG